MGGRFSFWGVAVVAMMLTTILCSSHCCRGSVLIKANATYGGVMTAELLIRGDITRYLMFEGAEPKTGNTENQNVKSCDNGQGNPMGICGGSANNQNQCDPYAGASACPS